jgi:hypothetical protein
VTACFVHDMIPYTKAVHGAGTFKPRAKGSSLALGSVQMRGAPGMRCGTTSRCGAWHSHATGEPTSICRPAGSPGHAATSSACTPHNRGAHRRHKPKDGLSCSIDGCSGSGADDWCCQYSSACMSRQHAQSRAHRQAVDDVDASQQGAGRVALREDGQPRMRRVHLRVEGLQLLHRT